MRLGGLYNEKFLAMLLCIVLPTVVFAADNGLKVDYDGGSLSGVKAGTGLRLYIDSERIRLMKDKNEVLALPASSITELSYGRDVFGAREKLPGYAHER